MAMAPENSVATRSNGTGVWESDEGRKDDSFNTFDEILQIAAQQNADLVLLGGDLFHDNKPSRRTVVRAMDILSRHCLNDRPIGFQVVSDQRQNFTTGQVNFENPNYNVGLPVFTIHGNHDDPAGSDNLSAVDILATGSLVNYFGKASIAGTGAGKVRIAPVLLQKGSTRISLYGLGNIRDERLCRLFSTPHSVEWVRPAATSDVSVDDWFNVFVLHQNRVAHTQAAKNCVREGHLPRFLDVVVWGHEHECLVDPWESVEGGGRFSVMQPGSSVATALSEGESKRKHVVLLEVMGHNWRTVKFPLETVRPFVFDTVALAGQPNVNAEDPKTVSAFLAHKVNMMITEAVRGRAPRTPELPLIRLRVDYTGFSTINTQRFGQGFVGKVANPHDIILWQKAVVRKPRATDATAAVPGVRLDNAEETRIEDIIANHLHHVMEILPEAELTDALRDFVDKDEKQALTITVDKALHETQAAAARDGAAVAAAAGEGDEGEVRPKKTGEKAAEEELAALISVAAKKRKAAVAVAATLRKAAAEAGVPAAAGGSGGGNAEADEDLESNDGMVMGGAGPSKARGKVSSKTAAAAARPPKAPARGTAAAKKAAAAPSKPRGRRVPEPTATPGFEPLRFTSTPAAPTVRTGSKRTAAAAAKKKLSAYKDTTGDGDRSGDEDFMEDDEVIRNTADSIISDSEDEDEDMGDDMEEDDLMVGASVQPKGTARGTTGRSAGRRGVPQGSLGLGSAAQPISLLDSDDEEEEERPLLRWQSTSERPRRGGTEIRPTPATGATGRSQLTLGRLGSQQPSRWGTLK